jgi:translation initiation factor 1
LADDLDIKRICKAFKKNFSCNGAVQKDDEDKEVIQLQGDQRTNVKDFLVDQEICAPESIVLHGF